jgi:hypothetical protein
MNEYPDHSEEVNLMTCGEKEKGEIPDQHIFRLGEIGDGTKLCG